MTGHVDSAAHTADRRLAGRLLEAARSSPDTVETHVSTVVFDGELVHKLKKAVRFPFVDLSTAERRAEMCHREVALNRRFASDVYLGVEDVVDDVGTVIDHAVLMRRMPADRRLAVLVSRGHDVSGCLRAVARAIAVCHARAPTSPVIASVAAPAALHELWACNLAELTPFAGLLVDDATVARIGELADRYLDGRSTLLTERIADGRVVDGHGDLLADDIFCLDDGPRILDCLEFDDRLRWGDVLYDVGFLAMDLERLGRADLGTSFLDSYREYAGETHPPSLEHHYIAYRALVRAKIACLRGEAAEARRYLDQCQRHLDAARDPQGARRARPPREGSECVRPRAVCAGRDGVGLHGDAGSCRHPARPRLERDRRRHVLQRALARRGHRARRVTRC
jgi:aminoglycoside phosphotransferase family enzyme